MDVVYFQVKSSLCTDAPSPEKNPGVGVRLYTG